jgi:hypothetical protein
MDSIQLILTERNLDTIRTSVFPMSATPMQDERVSELIRSLPPLSAPMAAARRLGVSAKQLDQALRSGAVPSVQIGATRFVTRAWLAEMLAQADGLKPQEAR